MSALDPLCPAQRFSGMDSKVHSEPAEVTADQGEVDQDGPGGAVASYEPGAAIETGSRLIDGGLKAQRQRRRFPPG